MQQQRVDIILQPEHSASGEIFAMLKLSKILVYWPFFEIYNNSETETMKPKGNKRH